MENPNETRLGMGNKVVVEIRGGVLVAAYCIDPGVDLYLVDWDELAQPAPRSACRFPVDPLITMPPETRGALDKDSPAFS